MFSKKIVGVALGLSLLVACGGGTHSDGLGDSTTITFTRPSNYVLKWQDDFSTSTLSGDWAYDTGAPLYGGTVWGNSERQYYRSDNASVVDGKLVIHHGRQYQVMTNSPVFDQQLALNAYWQQIGGTVMRRVEDGRYAFVHIHQRPRVTVAAGLSEGPRADLRAIAQRVQAHVVPLVSTVGWGLYDQYLKANGIERGRRSYTDVVRLVLGTSLGQQAIPPELPGSPGALTPPGADAAAAANSAPANAASPTAPPPSSMPTTPSRTP